MPRPSFPRPSCLAIPINQGRTVKDKHEDMFAKDATVQVRGRQVGIDGVQMILLAQIREAQEKEKRHIQMTGIKA